MNVESGNALVKELGPHQTRFFKTDVSSSESIAEAIAGTLEWMEKTEKPIGGVVAAAGVGNPAKIIDRHGEPMGMEGYDFVMNINVRGSVDLVRQLVPLMVKGEPEGVDGERGVIVLVSSSAA